MPRAQPALHWFLSLFLLAVLLPGVSSQADGDEGPLPAGFVETLDRFLDRYQKEAYLMANMANEASWTRDTDITDEHDAKAVEAKLNWSQFAQRMEKPALAFLNDRNLKKTDGQKRQLTKIADIGTSAQVDEAKLNRLNKIISEMESIYAKAEVCLDSPEECLKLEPGLTQLLSESRDCKKLTKAWEEWRDQSGQKMKELYPEYVKLSNEAVSILGHKDLGDYWKSKYDTETFEEDVAKLFDQIRPLYEQLHAYVRRKLKTVYDPEIFPSTGHIPAQLLGNMWSQSWHNIGKLVSPFKSKTRVDVGEEMVKQGYTVNRMFRTAEEFFASLGFDNMTDIFWEKSMLKRPTDPGREVVCHASAWDMDAKDDFRIKMCTAINQENLMTIHHEMGHIQYYMQYSDQPYIYQTGANPGFHEAVGDTIALSVGTPEHLRTIGLLKGEGGNDEEADINFLMQMALDKIAFLPFGYLIDQWRWSVFRGETPPKKYNEDWWNLRCQLQGISPPVKRSSDDFDPGAKYHVTADVPYIRYFVSFVIQFQFHKAACEAAGNTKPLHHCDIYNNPAAGEKIRSMLKLGSSRPWQDAMEEITGQRDMDAGPLMEYFRPLMDFLKKENGEDFGWESACPDNPPSCVDGAQRAGPVQLWLLAVLVVVTAVVNRHAV